MLLTSIYLNLFVCLLILNFHWKENKTIVYLLLIILIFNLRQITALLLNSDSNQEILAKIIFTMDPIGYLLGPIVLYYFKSSIQGKLVFDKKILLFCLPAILFFINIFPYYQLPLEEKIKIIRSIEHHVYRRNFPYQHTLFFSFKTQLKLILFSNIGFTIFSIVNYYVVKKANRIKAKNILYVKNIILLFFISIFPHFLLILFTSYQESHQVAFNIRSATNNYREYQYFITIFTPISFLLFPKLIYGINSNSTLSLSFRDFINIKFQKDVELSPELIVKSSDRDQIVEFIDAERPYLQANFSLHTLSQALNIPHLRVSSCFSKELNTTFPEYRNRKRIDYAIRLFKENTHHQMSIEGIAAQCGFKNKSSFYLAFKAIYKCTPTTWIVENL